MTKRKKRLNVLKQHIWVFSERLASSILVIGLTRTISKKCLQKKNAITIVPDCFVYKNLKAKTMCTRLKRNIFKVSKKSKKIHNQQVHEVKIYLALDF